jgi:hypothetical protein
MNAKSKRISDPRIFGVRINKFGVVAGKMRGFEVLRAIL